MTAKTSISARDSTRGGTDGVPDEDARGFDQFQSMSNEADQAAKSAAHDIAAAEKAAARAEKLAAQEAAANGK